MAKTTAARLPRAAFPGPGHDALADLPGLSDSSFVEQYWAATQAPLSGAGPRCRAPFTA